MLRLRLDSLLKGYSDILSEHTYFSTSGSQNSTFFLNQFHITALSEMKIVTSVVNEETTRMDGYEVYMKDVRFGTGRRIENGFIKLNS